MDIEWLGPQPKFKTGDNVFVVTTKKGESLLTKARIRYAPLEQWYRDNRYYLKFTGFYDLSIYTFSAGSHLPPSWQHEKYVFGTKEEAQLGAVFWPVDVDESQWLQAIGDRDIEAGHGNIEDGCDLHSCCAIVSNIRDMLIDVKENRGICEIDRLCLKDLLNSHNHADGFDGSALGKILSIMGL